MGLVGKNHVEMIYYTTHILQFKGLKGKCKKASAERQVSTLVAPIVFPAVHYRHLMHRKDNRKHASRDVNTE